MPVEKNDLPSAVLRQAGANIFHYRDECLGLQRQGPGKRHVKRSHTDGTERDEQAIHLFGDSLADHQ